MIILSSDPERAQHNLSLLARGILNSSNVWAVGSGASEIAAHKFCHSLRTIGVRANPLSTEGLFHGDIGAIKDDDFVLLISKGGKLANEDLLCDVLENHRGEKFLLTENNSAKLKGFTTLPLPQTSEIDPLGIVPSTSFLQCVAFLDQIVLQMIGDIGPSYGATFAKAHPAGSLGISFSASLAGEFNLPAAQTVSRDNFFNSSLLDLEKIINRSATGALCVCDSNQKMVGILTDGDIRRYIISQGLKASSSVLPDFTEVFFYLSQEATVLEALEIFASNPGVSVVPLLNDVGKPLFMLPARLLPSIIESVGK
jgi:D-arabinose 5-phosphate isomerase GutQ/CBS domain-containing protein